MPFGREKQTSWLPMVSLEISSDGNRITVGCPGAFVETVGAFAGSVRVLSFDGSDWRPLGQTSEGGEDFDVGESVTISGDELFLRVLMIKGVTIMTLFR